MKTVYFIKPVGMDGPIKVGCSQSPETRVGSLETWSPFALEIVARIEGDTTLEGRFHAYFADTHQRREWFGASAKLLGAIEAINAGTFDVSVLPEKPVGISSCRHGEPRRWSDATKFRVRLSHKVEKVQKASGFKLPFDGYFHQINLQDQAALDIINAFIAEPHVHGRPMEWEWAVARRAEYLAGLETRQQAA